MSKTSVEIKGLLFGVILLGFLINTTGQIALCDSVIIEHISSCVNKFSIIYIKPDSIVFSSDFHNYTHRNVKKEIFNDSDKCLFKPIYILYIDSYNEYNDSLNAINVTCLLTKRVKRELYAVEGVFQYVIYFNYKDQVLTINYIGANMETELFPTNQIERKKKRLKNRDFRKMKRGG